MFFTFDGIDGTGKSTQAALFCEWLGSLGHKIVRCRDPGTTQLGETLRQIVLQSQTMSINVRSETLIYMAARAQLVDEIIRPALAAGKTVVSDRFLLANVVYQAYGFGLDVSQVWEVGRFATANLQPTLTFLLDMDVELAARRLGNDADRMESRGTEYFRKVRAGFLAEAQKRRPQIAVVDAARPIEEVQTSIRGACESIWHAGA